MTIVHYIQRYSYIVEEYIIKKTDKIRNVQK